MATGIGLQIVRGSILDKEDAQNFGNALSSIFTLGTLNSPEPKHSTAPPILNVAGLSAIAGSISLFFIAHKNVRKASFSFSNDRISGITNGNFVFHNIPSLKISGAITIMILSKFYIIFRITIKQFSHLKKIAT